MDLAAEKNHLAVVQWLQDNQVEGCTTQAMDGGGEAGYLDMVKYLHDNCGLGCFNLAMDQAAASGHLDVVKFLHANRTEGSTKFALNVAACIKLLLGLSPEGVVREALKCAAGNGHLDVVKHLVDVCLDKCRTDIIDTAASCGHLKTVQWLYVYAGGQCSPAAMICVGQEVPPRSR